MAYRFTNTDKWDDSWFSNLKPSEKLLFNYLCDNCDIAGFIEINIKRWASDTGYDKPTIEGALKGLKRGLINSNTNDCIYLRTFLKHQKNLPLNPDKNMAHRGIIKRFDLYKEKFSIESIDAFLEGALKGPQCPYGIGKGNGSGSGLGKKNEDYIILFNKVLKDNNIELPEEFFNLILEWLKYKSEKGQTYKETGLKSFIVKAMTDCNGSAETLKNMILYSTSNNYSGLFKDTNNGTKNNKGNNGATNEQLAGYFANKYGTDSQQ